MTNRLPSLRGIETFLCVAEVLNFRLASERLNVTVSAISHRIQMLEQELGLQLLDRSRRQLRLTDDGAAYLERLRPGFRMLQDATMFTRRKVERPLLRIAAPPLLNGWLLSRLNSFRSSFPSARIEMLSNGRRRSASADISIVPLTASALRDGAQPLVTIQIAPACSQEFLDSNSMTKPEDLFKLTLIDSSPSLKGWQEWFRAAGVTGEIPPPSLSLDNHALLYQAVLDGHGVAICMRSLVADYLASGKLVEPFAIYCEFAPSLGILINESSNVQLVRAFKGWVIEQFSESAEILSTIDIKN